MASKTIGRIVLSFLLSFTGLCLGALLAGLKDYSGSNTASYVLSSLEADLCIMLGIVIFLILCVLGRQKNILNQQKEQLEVSRELLMLLKHSGEEQMPAKDNPAPDEPYHTEKEEKLNEL
ncbi:MAG TPA: hypothetical protein IAD07_01355 [Candidatus Fimivicinus intestinavium]|nr:hypothetical protein [Candidatus Fimivicinus intestinavium]